MTAAEQHAEPATTPDDAPPPQPPPVPPVDGHEPDDGDGLAPVPAPRRRRRRRWWLPWWARSQKVFLQAVAMWWASLGAEEIRAAWHDTRRCPGWLLLGAIAVLWPSSGFSLTPVGVAVGAWVLLMVATRRIYRWRTRRIVRRIGRRAIGLLALAVLALDAGVWAWVLALGLWLIAAGVSDTWRARERTLAWLVARVATAVRADPDQLDFVVADWDGRGLIGAELEYGDAFRAEEAAVREKVAGAITWALRNAGRYRIEWPPGATRLIITADPALPERVDEPELGDDLPGIPLGVTDEDTADGHLDSIDPGSGAVVSSIPVALFNPTDAEKHLLVIGGTGAGKTVWTRGFVARGLRKRFFPGGVFILDGKGSSDYVVFEGREGVRCVARDPDEWTKAMSEIVPLMRSRYDADAEYHRGNRAKPDMPLYLVVIEEIQLIRETLGKDFDTFLQQISRQMRASGGRLMVITQRPDTADSMPGPVRDMLEERVVLGYVSSDGARMAFGKDWKRLVDEYGEKTVRGRGMARIGGRFLRLQGFYLGSPREEPEAEKFYPPKTGQDDRGADGRREQAKRAPARWAPSDPIPQAEDAVAKRPEDDSEREVPEQGGPSAAGQGATRRPRPTM